MRTLMKPPAGYVDFSNFTVHIILENVEVSDKAGEVYDAIIEYQKKNPQAQNAMISLPKDMTPEELKSYTDELTQHGFLRGSKIVEVK